MSDDITQDYLDGLKTVPKKVKNPGARWHDKPLNAPAHKQREFHLESAQNSFTLYQRQNLKQANDFSCGIVWRRAGEKDVTLARYNGSSHIHGEIEYKCHIHQTKAEEINAGCHSKYAILAEDRYKNLNGALCCLAEDFCIMGLPTESDAKELFD